MKTRNQWFAMALIGIAALSLTALSLTGCTQNDSPPPPEQPIPYGELPNGVKIYKGDSKVTDAQMATAVQNAIEGYNAIDIETYGSPDGKFTKVVIFSSSDEKSYTWDGNVLGVRANRASGYFRGRFEDIADGSLPLTNGEPPETFTVTFHANGGTPEPPAQTVEKGKTASEPAAMTKANSDFEGWYKESGFTTQWIFASGSGVAADTVSADVALYAKWTPYYGALPNTTIKIYKGDSNVTDEQMATAVQNVIAGYNGLDDLDVALKPAVTSRVTKILIISDRNYSWDGSVLGLKYDRTSDSITGRFEMVADDSIILTTGEIFTVTFHANGGTPEPPAQTVEKGNSASEPPAPTKANYTLEGWYKESALTTKWIFASGSGVAADTVSADIALYAKWILADTAFRLYEDVVMFTDSANDDYPYYADIKDARTGAREKTLEEILDANNKNIVERLQNAVVAAYGASGNAAKSRYRAVFDGELGKVVITIENNTSYDSYKVGETFNDLRISFEYLSTVSDADLQTAINSAVTEMKAKFDAMI